MSKCSGCGIEIQNQNQDKAGYIPFSVMTERMAAGDEREDKRTACCIQ